MRAHGSRWRCRAGASPANGIFPAERADRVVSVPLRGKRNWQAERPPYRKTSRAFSLFEIVVAMVILGLISGAVLSIIWQAGDSAAEIRDLDQRDEEVGRFLTLLRETVENLPPDGTLAITPAEESTSGYPELTIGNSATAFTFGETVGSAEESVIALRPGDVSETGEQLFNLALSRADFAPDDETGSGMVFRAGEGDLMEVDEDGRYWLTLVSGVRAASWRYWEEEQREWIEEWTDDSTMPPLLEFAFADTYQAFPKRMIFQVPEQVVDPGTAEAAANAANTTSQTSSVQSSDSGSGRGGRGGRGGGGDRGRGDRGSGDRGERGGDGDRGQRPGGDDRSGGQRPGGGSGRPGGSGGGNGGGGAN